MTISPHTILNTPCPEPAAPPRGSSFWRLAYYVTPAEAGSRSYPMRLWIPAFAGMTCERAGCLLIHS